MAAFCDCRFIAKNTPSDIPPKVGNEFLELQKTRMSGSHPCFFVLYNY